MNSAQDLVLADLRCSIVGFPTDLAVILQQLTAVLALLLHACFKGMGEYRLASHIASYKIQHPFTHSIL